ncbi:MAG: serine/threonine protein kinase, partial [Polyangiaceae bacterium]|nr:serine/threonine protein kinase [Polyangiaceae bacterium]
MSAAPIRRLLGPGEPLLGTRLVVRRALGQGGMGEVYEVEHVDLGRRFAVKLLHRLHAGRPDLAARMRAEARSVARLRHPNLVDVFDLGATADGRTYFVMELLCGRDLRAELAGARYLEVAAALACMEQALEGLAAAHEAGIVHRDVKLENLFLCEGGLLKLLDFGVAKLDSAGAWQTAADALVGTPRTMAPEQCRPGPVDARADLYAAGLALYELVTGRGPFDDLRGQPDALRFAHCDRPPPPPSRIAPQPIPPDVERIILRALEKSPARRFQTAREMAAEIRLALARLDEPSPDLRALSSASLPASASVPVPASAPVSVPVAVSVAVPVPASVSVSVSAS